MLTPVLSLSLSLSLSLDSYVSGLTPAPAAVQAWWSALASAQYIPPAAAVTEVLAADGVTVTTPARDAELLGELELPPDITWFLKSELGRKLLVRPCYKDFWNTISPVYGQAQNPATRGRTRFIFTGVPGIGKASGDIAAHMHCAACRNTVLAKLTLAYVC